VRVLSKGESEKKEKVIVIDVIETPRGPVPSAESLKSLVEAWNEVLSTINENTSELVNMMKRIEDHILKLSISISKLVGKLDSFAQILSDLKVSMDSLKDEFAEIRESNLMKDEKLKKKAKKHLDEILK